MEKIEKTIAAYAVERAGEINRREGRAMFGPAGINLKTVEVLPSETKAPAYGSRAGVCTKHVKFSDGIAAVRYSGDCDEIWWIARLPVA